MTAEDTHDSDVLCGVGKFRPRWLQIFNNPKAMFVFMSIYGFTHGNDMIFVIRSTVETSNADIGRLCYANESLALHARD